VYNSTSNIWLTTTLSQPRYLLASTSSRNKIFFGGGAGSDIVDIFDFDPSSQFPSTTIPSIPTSNYSRTTNSIGKMKFDHENCCFEIQI
jgi:hypothetical protein